jgi:hypothetical protein
MASLHSSMPTVFSHAVSRSNELLSCAKTAVKIAQRKHASSGAPTDTPDTPDTYNWWTVKLTDLQLYDGSNQEPHVSHEVLEDGLSLLRTMEGELKHLEGLVRRRGHTNDPTEEISLSVKRLELDTQEVMDLIKTMIPLSARGQGQRHWQMLQQWFQSVVQQQGIRLKEILKVRGKVLAEQAQRRKRFQASSNTTNTTTNAQFDSPLFTAPAHRPAPVQPVQPPPKQSQSQLPPVLSNGTHAHVPPPVINGNGASTTHVHGAHGNGAYGASSSNGNGSAAPAARTTIAASPYTAPAATTSTATVTATTSRPTSTLSSSTMAQQRPRPTSGGYSYYGGNGPTGNSAYGGGATSGGYGRTGTGGYGGSAANASYYVGGNSSSSSVGGAVSGMRQRRQVAASATTQDNDQSQDFAIQEQMQIRQQERKSQLRLKEARQAEKTLATVATLFGKMSTMISQQAEVVDKVEDDVEAAFLDVAAGHEEITTLYSIKKGNRALIIKVFGILIFFILFMRIYKK